MHTGGGRRLLEGTNLLCFDERIVISRVVHELALVGEMNHVCAHSIEEVLGVRNEQQDARVVGKLILQPHAGLHVQVVSRLVQEKHGGLKGTRYFRDYLKCYQIWSTAKARATFLAFVSRTRQEPKMFFFDSHLAQKCPAECHTHTPTSGKILGLLSEECTAGRTQSTCQFLTCAHVGVVNL
jgi:hypothetical protein